MNEVAGFVPDRFGEGLVGVLFRPGDTVGGRRVEHLRQSECTEADHDQRGTDKKAGFRFMLDSQNKDASSSHGRLAFAS